MNTTENVSELRTEEVQAVVGGDDNFEERWGAMVGFAIIGGMTGGTGYVVAAFIVGGSLLLY